MSDGSVGMPAGAARRLGRLLAGANPRGCGRSGPDDPSDLLDEDPVGTALTLTDGGRLYHLKVVRGHKSPLTLFVCSEGLPPSNCDLFVVDGSVLQSEPRSHAARRSMVCFTPGTRILTPKGPVAVEALRPGDRVETGDNGPCQIVWTGSRTIGGARLYAMPDLRPIRIRAGALATGRPDADLIVSPDHRLLLKGRSARRLFSTPEVLVAARDLLTERSITVDHAAARVTYHHLLLETHQILWANGLPCESFHPVDADLDHLEDAQRLALVDAAPDVYRCPADYGPYARRALGQAEAQLLRAPH